MDSTIDFQDPRYQHLVELAERLARMPEQERAQAIQRALLQERLAAHETEEDLVLYRAIESMTTDELKVLIDEVESSGLAELLRELLHESALPALTGNPKTDGPANQ